MEKHPEQQPHHIAIIGMAGRFPGAGTLEQFWHNLINGVCSLQNITDAELRHAGVPEHLIDNPDFVKVAYAVDAIDGFDAGLFQFTPREAEITDPQQRILLECSYEALEHAGYAAEKYPGLIGVYAGVGSMSYYIRNLTPHPQLLDSIGALRVSIGNEKSFAATMVSYKLDLQGPSVNVDTACSTSLVAVHQACQSLLAYECDMVLAGGVSIDIPQKTGMLYKEGGIVSPDGICRPFDRDARGTVKGNGAGMVVLKRLEDALSDGDTIHAVIRGSAVNNDGALKVGYTASSIEGQIEVIADALARAEVEPDTISYVETHGTGTILGDPIEVSALSEAFGERGRPGGCAIGSVKANIGHLDIAAGVAGLIKTTLALRYRRIPPSINYSGPNPNIDFENAAFYVNTENREWVVENGTRRAGVSSFGIGGTNAHVILEEAPAAASLPSTREAFLLPFSARTPRALQGQLDKFAAFLADNPDIDIADAAYTLQMGRKDHPYRACVAGTGAGELSNILAQRLRALSIGEPQPEKPTIYFMFPGQGAQHAAMARDLYRQERVFREHFDRCARHFQALLGCDLKAQFMDAQAAKTVTKNSTLTAQPALFAVEYALACYWHHLGIKPVALIGHSLGEYVAACLAGVLSLDDAVTLVARRAELMNSMAAGMMLMVHLSEREVQPYLSERCSLAAVNGPSICVVSGGRDTIEALQETFAGKGIDARVLPTSHAFHSWMMEPVLEAFAETFNDIQLREPGIPYISNVTGTWITGQQATDPAYWVSHLRGTVRFSDGLQKLLEDENALLLEVGPSQVLTTLAKRSYSAADKAISSCRHPQEERNDLSALLNAAGQLWLRGCEVDWSAFYSDERRRRIPLPTYAFDRKTYWISPPGAQQNSVAADTLGESGGEVLDRDVDSPSASAKPVVAAKNLEQRLQSLWAQAFGLDKIHPSDTFFELGGDSLLATQLTATIRSQLNVNLSLSELFSNPVFSDLLNILRSKADAEGVDIDTRAANPIVRVEPDLANRYQPFPLTDIQQAYWIGRSGSIELGDVATHIYLEVDIKEGEVERFNRAWNRLIDRHEMLRTVFLDSGQQQILETVPEYRFDIIELDNDKPDAAQEKLMALRERMSHQMLPADTWPLFDIKAAKFTATRFRLCISIDILIVDAWSMNMLIEQWLQLYTNPGLELPPIEFSFRDYVLAERGLRETELFYASEEYWFDRLDRIPPAPALPIAKAPSQITATRFERRTYEMPKERWSLLKARAVKHGLTPSGMLMAAFSEVLALWCQSPRFTINLTLYSRHPFHPAVDKIVGDFTSLTLLEVNNDASASFLANAQSIQRQLWSDLDYRYVSAIHVLRELGRRRGSRVSMPIVFTSTLGVRELEHENDAADNLGEEVFGVSQTSQVWLDHQVMEWKGRLRFNWDAVADIFPPGMIEDMFDAYCALVERLVDDESLWNRSIGDRLLPEKHRALIDHSNATERAFDLDLLHIAFEKRVEKQADAVAVIAADRTLSYRELYAYEQVLGTRLRRGGVEPNQVVALFLEKGWRQIAGCMAALASGGAYLPLDPELPDERLAYILQNSAAKFVITQASLKSRLEHSTAGVEVVDIDQVDIGDLPAEPLSPVQCADDLAYVIYTSGTTGRPKGVMIPHRGAANTIADINSRIGIQPSDRVLALSALNFDLSVYDVFGTLAGGAALVMPCPAQIREPAAWAELIETHRVTLWNSVPALMQMLVDFAGNNPVAPCIRTAILSGDWIPPQLPKQMQTLWPEMRVLGAGGPTECSIWSACHWVQPYDYERESVTYGRPMANQTIHILNSQLKSCPIWAEGEMYIGGRGLALGYMADPERTRATFVRHPVTGEPVYKSGDMGRYLSNGDIEILGRTDFQVKINGYRIELGEVEGAIKETGLYKNAVVVAAKGDNGKNCNRLIAYLVDEHSNPAEGPDAAQENARETAAPSDFGISDQARLVQFKLEKPGIRKTQPGEATLSLPTIDRDIAAYKKRKSYREFLGADLGSQRLSNLLGKLSALQGEAAPMPKYRYASAGSLHSVQVYLHVKAGGVSGIDSGCYYYQPETHALIKLSGQAELTRASFGVGDNPDIFERCVFTLFLVGESRALTPVYGEESARNFMYLEAGYMAQLLMESAPDELIGLCPLGYVDRGVEDLLGLQNSQAILHCMAGGAITRPQVEAWTSSGKTAVPAAAGRDTVETLRQLLREKLPDYMLPGAFVVVDSLPLTANGKVDRKKLSEQEVQQLDKRPVTPPRNDTERSILAIWQRCLEREDIGVDDNFFQIGGDSVLIAKIHQHLQEELGAGLMVVDLFKYPKISELAQYLTKAEPQANAMEDVAAKVGKQKAALKNKRKRDRQGV